MSEDHNQQSNGRPPNGRRPASRDDIVQDVLAIYEDAATGAATSDEAQLRRLIQALRNRQGRFGLIFAVCNDPAMRRKLSARIAEALRDPAPVELTLTGEEESLLDVLAAAPGAPAPLIVYGLELLLPSADEGRVRREHTLQELQLRREQFRSLARPLLLWMPEYAYSLIGQRAVDFWSWQSGGFFFNGRQTPTQRAERGPTSKLAAPSAAAPAELSGRERIFAQAAEALRQGITVLLYGIAGAGKSDLALYAARALAPDFPDGQLLIALGEHSDDPRLRLEGLREAVRAFLPDSTLPEDQAVLTALYRSLLGGRRVLVVLDDAPDVEAVRPFLPPEGSALLVTARERLPIPNGVAIAVDRLLPEEALALLQSLAPAIPEDAARTLVALCAYLPLAIRLVGGMLSAEPDPARSSAPLVEALRLARQRRLEASPGGEEATAALEAALQLSYNLLGREAARTLRLLAVFPSDFDRPAAEAVADDPHAEQTLGLLGRGLVQQSSAEGRLSLHSLSRRFAAAQRSPAEEALAAERHARHYARLLDGADELYRSGHEQLREGLARFDREWPNIRAAQRWAAAQAASSDELANLCVSFPLRGRRLLALRRPQAELLAWLDDGLAAARRLGLDEAEATLLLLRGQEQAGAGQTGQAIADIEAALAIFRARDDGRRTALALAELSKLYRDGGDWARAVEAAEAALRIQRARGDKAGERTALESLGLARRRQGRLDGALDALQEALAVARAAQDQRGEAAALYSLGHTAQLQGDYRAALDRYREALALAESFGDQAAIGRLLAGIGLTLSRLGEHEAAQREYRRGIAIASAIGDRALEGTLESGLAAAALAAGELDAALDAFHRALDIARAIGDRRAEATTLNSIGAAYRTLGDYKRADELFRQALAIAEADGNQDRVASVLNNLGHSYRSAGDYPAAERMYRQALELARASKDLRREAAMLHNLGQTLLLQHDPERALDCFSQQLAITRQAGDRYGAAAALRGLSHVYARQGELEQAIASARESLALLEQLRHPEAAELRAEIATLMGAQEL